MSAHSAASAVSMTAASSSSTLTGSALARAASTASCTAATAVNSNNSNSNWRSKYLRALNISSHEVDVACKTPVPTSNNSKADNNSNTATQQQQLRRARSYRADVDRSVAASRSFHTATERVNRYQVARTSSRRQMLQAANNKSNSNNENNNCNNNNKCHNNYGFAVKPDLARGRRCHTSPTMNDENATAPILIPSAAPMSAASCSRLSDLVGCDGATSNSDRRSPLKRVASNYRHDAAAGKLLSWEEPSVMMMAPQQSVNSNGLDRAFSHLQLHRNASSRSSIGTDNSSVFVVGSVDDVFADEFVETDDDASDDDDDDDDDDAIFAMEDVDTSSNNSSPDKTRGHRRPRSASVAVAAPFGSRSTAGALTRFHSVRQLRCNGSSSSNALELPASFVPPHEMVERDCFSIGMRDAFKRRPAKI